MILKGHLKKQRDLVDLAHEGTGVISRSLAQAGIGTWQYSPGGSYASCSPGSKSPDSIQGGGGDFDGQQAFEKTNLSSPARSQVGLVRVFEAPQAAPLAGSNDGTSYGEHERLNLPSFQAPYCEPQSVSGNSPVISINSVDLDSDEEDSFYYKYGPIPDNSLAGEILLLESSLGVGEKTEENKATTFSEFPNIGGIDGWGRVKAADHPIVQNLVSALPVEGFWEDWQMKAEMGMRGFGLFRYDTGSLERLHPRVWLNEEIIHGLIASFHEESLGHEEFHLKQRVETSCPPAGEEERKENLAAAENKILIFPFNKNSSQWVLVSIDHKGGILTIYDPGQQYSVDQELCRVSIPMLLASWLH